MSLVNIRKEPSDYSCSRLNQRFTSFMITKWRKGVFSSTTRQSSNSEIQILLFLFTQPLSSFRFLRLVSKSDNLPFKRKEALLCTGRTSLSCEFNEFCSLNFSLLRPSSKRQNVSFLGHYKGRFSRTKFLRLPELQRLCPRLLGFRAALQRGRQSIPRRRDEARFGRATSAGPSDNIASMMAAEGPSYESSGLFPRLFYVL